MESNKDCQKCKGTGLVKEKDGSVHTCWDCLQNDQFNQHGNPRDSGIKI